MRNLAKFFAWVILAALLVAGQAVAQNANSGEFKGTVTDASGAVVPAVQVSILNTQTGTRMTTTTNASGIYDAPSVPPGQYSISFSKTGFRDFVRTGIVLQLQTIQVDATLQVGSTAQQVVVNAAAPLVETETSQQHVTFNTQTVLNAPIVGGVWYNELTTLLPGVNGGGGQAATGQGVGVNGTQGYNSNWLMEGAGVTDPRDYNPSDNYPPVDSIAEVSANTSNFGAQYGNGLAAFNVILKSGANRWHGSLFEFIQNDALNTRNFFQHGFSAPERWNQFGGSVGGPVVKNKLFFFFNYQRNPSHTSSVNTYTYPTQAMRSGDFSNSSFATIYDPATTVCSGGTCSRTAFPGNRVTSIDPVAAKIQQYWPLPNRPGLANNYVASVISPGLSTWYVTKIDYDASARNRIAGSLLEYPIAVTYNNDPLCPNPGSTCTPSAPNRNQDAQITETWTISPTIVNEGRIGYMRELDKYSPPDYGKNLPATLGMEPAYGTNAPGNVFPSISVDGLGAVGGMSLGPGVHAVLAEDLATASDVLTLIRGKHTVKFGGEFDKNYQNYTNWGDVSSGNFEFNGISTGNPATRALGVPYADFLLGDVYGWYVYDYDETGARMWNSGLFVNDDYRVKPHLTLNLGLRWQMQSGWSEAHNEFGVFDPTLTNPATRTPGAILYGGKNGRSKIEANVYGEFAPRIGLAWSPRDRWSIRASYGIFDSPRPSEAYTDGALGLGFNPHGSTGYAGFPGCAASSCAAFPLRTGPAPGSVVFPTLQTLSPALNNGSSVDFYPLNIPITYIQETYFDVQHQLPGDVLLDVGYVLTKGTHLNFVRSMNQVNIAAGAKTAPFPQYQNIVAHLFDGYSNYNALQLRAEKRMSHGFTFMANYAWSNTLDTGTGSGHGEGIDLWQNAYNVAANYGDSKLNSPNTFTGDVTYQVPFGTGRAFPLHGFWNAAIGGWRVSTIFDVNSGLPFTPVIASSISNSIDPLLSTSGYRLFPNRIASGTLPNPTISDWFNQSAFVNPAANTFGNAGRNILRGPAYRDLDLSLAKVFKLSFREGTTLEIRADAFDVLNHPNFGLPGATLESGGVGVITSANNYGPGRIVQLGARLSF